MEAGRMSRLSPASLRLPFTAASSAVASGWAPARDQLSQTIGFAQGFLLGFLNHNLEDTFQSWYMDQLLNHVDWYALVACGITHLVAFLPQAQRFSLCGMVTSGLSFALVLVYFWAITAARPVWKQYRRQLLIFRRMVLLLLFQHVFANIDAPPPAGWYDLTLRLVLTSGAFRIMLKTLVYADLFEWSAPLGLLSLYSVSKPAATSLCGPIGILTRSEFSQDAIRQLSNYVGVVLQRLPALPGSMTTSNSPWEQQCTQVVHVSQVLFGLVLPLTAIYCIEAYYRRRFLLTQFPRQSHAGFAVHKTSELVEFSLMIAFVAATGLIATGLSVTIV